MKSGSKVKDKKEKIEIINMRQEKKKKRSVAVNKQNGYLRRGGGGKKCENLISPKRNIFSVVQKNKAPLLASGKGWTANWNELMFVNKF
jgi:hypothetical protein